MNKVTLGNDFTDDSSDDSEKRVIASGNEPDEEKDDSADSLDSENHDDEDESSDSDDGQDADESDEDSKEDSGKQESSSSDEESDAKKRELEGLLDTEKKLDGDLGTIDQKIQSARERIVEKRRARREGRELAEKVDGAVPQDPSEQQDDLADIDPETIKVLERFTKARGLVPKSEITRMTYEQAHKSAEKSFYESHPEYLPEHDDSDTLYDALKEELKNFAAPTDASMIPKLFERAHKLVQMRFPDKFKKATTVDKKKTDAASSRVQARQIGGGASGGGSGGKSQSSGSGNQGAKQFDEQQIAALRSGGWSDEDIKELQSKYK